MLHFETIAYTIGSHFLSALINGDETGLSDEEIAELAEFLETLPPNGHWDCSDTETHFARCEITGMRGDCSDVLYLYRS